MAMRPALSLRGRALQLLAQRKHSQVELRRKLTAHAVAAAGNGRQRPVAGSAGAEPGVADGDAAAGIDAGIGIGEGPPSVAARVDAVLAWLQANRLSSDERFAESRVRVRSARFGNRRIYNELSQHGVVPSCDLAAELATGEFQRALQVWMKKFGGTAPEGLAAQVRQYRFLVGRGFSPDVVHQLMRRVTREPVPDAETFFVDPR